MALTGKYPLLIFKIYTGTTWKPGENPDPAKTGKEITLKEWQNMTELHRTIWHTPIPIPIYLDENFTEIACDEADQNIDFTHVQAGDLTFETTVGADTVLSLRANKDNTVLTMIMAAIKQISELLSTQMYGITLYYDGIFVLNGMLKNITQSTVNGTNIKLISLTITERPPETNKDSTGTKQPIPNTPGTSDGPNGFQR